MIEVLAGDGFDRAVTDLGLSAKKKWSGDRLEVWSVSDDDHDKLIGIHDEEWKSEWGWWRSAKGSNVSCWPTHIFMVNGNWLVGYYDEDRLAYFIDGETIEEDYFAEPYTALTQYICDVIGASTEGNICAVATDLAKLNGMTMAELFEKYQ